MDYPGEPDVISRVLTSERGKEKSQNRKAGLATAAFKGARGAYRPQADQGRQWCIHCLALPEGEQPLTP